MDNKEVKSYMDQGYMHLIVLFEIVGNPKEHVSKALETVISKVKENSAIKVIKDEKGEPEDAGGGLFGTYCEAELLVKDLSTLSWLSFNFMPASIEVKAPAKITFKDKELTDFFGDMMSHVHESNKRVVATSSSHKTMLLNINKLMRNIVLISLNQEEKTAEELADKIGIQSQDIAPLLDAMIQEKTIEKVGEKYAAIARK